MSNTNNDNQPAPPATPTHLTPAYQLFLEKLVNARNAAGVTRVELAKRLKVPETHILEAETGTRPLDFLAVRAWCRALDINLTDFTETLDALITATLETPPAPDKGE